MIKDTPLCLKVYLFFFMFIDSEPNRPDPENSIATAKSETEDLRWVTQHTTTRFASWKCTKDNHYIVCFSFYDSLSYFHSNLSSGLIASQVDWWRVPCLWQHLPIKLFSLDRLGLRRWVWELFTQVAEWKKLLK